MHRYDGKCRHLRDFEMQELCNSKEPSLRLAIDSCDLEFDDRWQGKQHIHLEGELDDYVLRRGDGMYAYNLAVVLDDIAMGITEVIRGDDLLDTTGQQLYLYWSASRILGELAVAGGLIDGAKYSHSQISLSDLIHLDLSVPSLRQKTIVIE